MLNRIYLLLALIVFTGPTPIAKGAELDFEVLSGKITFPKNSTTAESEFLVKLLNLHPDPGRDLKFTIGPRFSHSFKILDGALGGLMLMGGPDNELKLDDKAATLRLSSAFPADQIHNPFLLEIGERCFLLQLDISETSDGTTWSYNSKNPRHVCALRTPPMLFYSGDFVSNVPQGLSAAVFGLPPDISDLQLVRVDDKFSVIGDSLCSTFKQQNDRLVCNLSYTPSVPPDTLRVVLQGRHNGTRVISPSLQYPIQPIVTPELQTIAKSLPVGLAPLADSDFRVEYAKAQWTEGDWGKGTLDAIIRLGKISALQNGKLRFLGSNSAYSLQELERGVVETSNARGDSRYFFDRAQSLLFIHGINQYENELTNPFTMEIGSACKMLIMSESHPEEGRFEYSYSPNMPTMPCTFNSLILNGGHIIPGVKIGTKTTLSLDTGLHQPSNPTWSKTAKFELIRIDEALKQVGEPLATRTGLDNGSVTFKHDFEGEALGLVRLAVQTTVDGSRVISPPLRLYVRSDGLSGPAMFEAMRRERQQKKEKLAAEQKEKTENARFNLELLPSASSPFPDFDAEIKPFRSYMEIFTDGKGHYLATAQNSIQKDRKLQGYHPENNLFLLNPFFWGDATSMFQLLGGAMSRGNTWQNISITRDAGGAVAAQIERLTGKAILTCGQDTLELHAISEDKALAFVKKVKLLPPPRYREAWALGRIDGTDEVFYIDHPSFVRAYDAKRLFIGRPGALKEIKIDRVDYMLDGGSTFILTARGSFNFPVAHHESPPTLVEKNGKTAKLVPLEAKGSELRSIIGPDLFASLTPIPNPDICDVFSEGKAAPVKQQASSPGPTAVGKFFDATTDIPRYTMHILRTADLKEIKRIELDTDTNHLFEPMTDSTYWKGRGRKGEEYFHLSSSFSLEPVSKEALPQGLATVDKPRRDSGASNNVLLTLTIGATEYTITSDLVGSYPKEKEIKTVLVESKSSKAKCTLPDLVPAAAYVLDGKSNILYYTAVSRDAPMRWERITAFDLKACRALHTVTLNDVGHNWGKEQLKMTTTRSMALTPDGHLVVVAGNYVDYM